MNAPLDREEYIEQTYFFRVYRERLDAAINSQEILERIQDEILATTKLPMAIEFLHGEIELTGRISDGMARLSHYFTPFQAFIMHQAEEDRSKFEQTVALVILEREAEYRAESPPLAGLFVYQFECIARNRLGYEAGMFAMAHDPMYPEEWRDWILKARRRLGETDFPNLIYHRSQHYVTEQRRRTRNDQFELAAPVLFGEQEGRMAKASIGRDPLFLFAALQRQLGYPAVPKPVAKPLEPDIPLVIERRLQRLELRLQMLETDEESAFDLTKFYVKPDDPAE
ncbi:MAG: hypothetical protein O3A00_12135 [Planctomycetota bacterium]|nr:hypothetical protein [Planctomycetota bacterium]